MDDYILLNYLILVKSVGENFDTQSEYWEKLTGRIVELEKLLKKTKLSRVETLTFYYRLASVEILYLKTKYLLNKISKALEEMEEFKAKELLLHLNTKQEYNNFLKLNATLETHLFRTKEELCKTSLLEKNLINNSFSILELQEKWENLILINRKVFEPNVYLSFLNKEINSFWTDNLYNKIKFVMWLRWEKCFHIESFDHVCFLWMFDWFPESSLRWSGNLNNRQEVLALIPELELEALWLSTSKKIYIIESLIKFNEEAVKKIIGKKERTKCSHDVVISGVDNNKVKTNELLNWKVSLLFFFIFFVVFLIFLIYLTATRKNKKNIREKNES